MEFDYSKLRGRIVEKFGTIGAFADALGNSFVTVSNYLNNKFKFNQDTIIRWCGLLEIAIEDAAAYFFVLRV